MSTEVLKQLNALWAETLKARKAHSDASSAYLDALERYHNALRLAKNDEVRSMPEDAFPLYVL